jgi:hypothetical protein
MAKKTKFYTVSGMKLVCMHIDDIADMDGGTDYEALMTVDDKIQKL